MPPRKVDFLEELSHQNEGGEELKAAACAILRRQGMTNQSIHESIPSALCEFP